MLWASPRTQRARFEIIRLMYDRFVRSVLDAGCGRGDYLAYLIEQGTCPSNYIGIEAVGALADAACASKFPHATIIQADFVWSRPGYLSAPISWFSAVRSTQCAIKNFTPRSGTPMTRQAWRWSLIFLLDLSGGKRLSVLASAGRCDTFCRCVLRRRSIQGRLSAGRLLGLPDQTKRTALKRLYMLSQASGRIDVHSHLLPGVDDGCATLADSLNSRG